MLTRLFTFLIVSTSILVCTPTIAEHLITDSNGQRTLAGVPQRVAVLNWDLAEQVIELGVAPVAMPGIKDYQKWVVKPALPEGVVDIGTRVEPNYELLATLKPDVIFIASPQKDLTDRLSKIAPVLLYQTYSEKHDNAEATLQNFRKIAQVLGKEKVAEEKLAFLNQQLDALKQKLDVAFPGQKPKVTTFRFASETSVYIYGKNSIPEHVLQLLGFENAMPQPATQWGVTQKVMTDLRQIGNGIALYFLPFNERANVERSVVWKAMPFVRNKKVASIESTWSYGGAMSLLYNAEALSESLLRVANAQ
ncbi:iron-hydroxamate ABC transporter substrate-binding protein [Veronia nyctiphanis]|uniref:Iron-hydroxamate ABC transporter substrate-binding protein n=1 Tax=Veronia nyctiphanis TaxID=1278244 RepID=A0A4Q0YRV5_9GAMM|nr:iron-siderophore ABC transporter substrate-binding protein [Veronia nyctiphanis]RXJ73920.1 iron-hydroxamate ABC transporter substrate-binding protein [Veronia nyctiphanis]